MSESIAELRWEKLMKRSKISIGNSLFLRTPMMKNEMVVGTQQIMKLPTIIDNVFANRFSFIIADSTLDALLCCPNYV